MMMTTFLWFAACGGAPSEAPPAPAASPVPETDAADVEPGAVPAKVVPEPAPRFTPPPPAAGLKGVDFVGHGLRVRVYPPFQVVSFAPGEGAEMLIVSWWDVTDPQAGAGAGRGGLHGATVAVHPVPDGSPTVERRVDTVKGREVVRYRLGETGSYVELGGNLENAGGMLTVEPGPSDPSWAVEVNGKRTPVKTGHFVHSADPSTGTPFDQVVKPHQPWGHWPTP